LIVFSVSALIVAALYFFQQRREPNTSFNINVSFRNNEIKNDFPTNLSKSPSSHFTRQLPNVLGFSKGFEVINNDHNENHFSKADQMQNFSDEEYLADAEFSTAHDQTEKLIN
jgi:hypothetical protein